MAIAVSDELGVSVEQKQISEQQAQQAIETAKGAADSAVIAADGAAKARLIQAQAEADSLKLIQDAIANNPELLTYQYISKLAPNINVMLLPSDAPFVFSIPGVTS
jgi:regulator of protease activity HflC (stomatin/prohibitin superfamily)